MESIYKKIQEIEQNNVPAALATIVSTQGSTPRKSGTKMIVYADGKIFGTVGGGNLEKKIIDDALTVIKDNQSTFISYKLEQDLGMGCGGKVDVFIETIASKIPLYILGAGHIGQVLAEFADRLGFAVTLIDCRNEIIEKISNTNFTVILSDYETATENISFSSNTFITIMTHSHDYDQLLTSLCAKKEFGYLGVIASKNKIAKFRKYYIDNSILSEEEMMKINWPMGVPIACQSPEEIAISILAKLIDTRCKLLKID